MKTQLEKDAQLGRVTRVVLFWLGIIIVLISIYPSFVLCRTLWYLAYDYLGYGGLIALVIGAVIVFLAGCAGASFVGRTWWLAGLGERALNGDEHADATKE
jgi:hypothetical protein